MQTLIEKIEALNGHTANVLKETVIDVIRQHEEQAALAWERSRPVKVWDIQTLLLSRLSATEWRSGSLRDLTHNVIEILRPYLRTPEPEPQVVVGVEEIARIIQREVLKSDGIDSDYTTYDACYCAALALLPYLRTPEPASQAAVDDMLLDPRRWTLEMNEAWHRAIPDLHAAFAALRAFRTPEPAPQAAATGPIFQVLPELCPQCGGRLIHNWRGIECGEFRCSYSRGGEPFRPGTPPHPAEPGPATGEEGRC